jgi:glycosyltransferase involved in cell wall biosynthesis
MSSRKAFVGRLLARARARWAATYVDQIIAVSEFVRRRDADDDYFPAAKIRVVCNGVDTDRFVPLTSPPNEVFTLAYAGQLIPEKGILTLLQAVRLMRDRGQPARLRIAGEGPQATELRQFCTDHGLGAQVDFLGQIDWMERFFCEADVVVVPSEWEEAFGFVAAEAAACGACVAVSSAGALPEVIGTGGEAGVIFARGDANDLARQLVELKADPARRHRMRLAARQLAVTRFSMPQMVQGYCDYFEQIEVRTRN